jgi:ParB family chromosome partitioning protein
MGEGGAMSRDRKTFMKSLLAGEDGGAKAQTVEAPDQPARGRAGAIGALGASLARLAEQSDIAAELEKALSRGESVVEIDPSQVTNAFVRDRLSLENDKAFQTLKDSIAESGQQVPILVRPDPARPGTYQVAYGHRRLEAARALGRKVRAVMRPLDDAALVLAQGQENSARADLTHIERARFAGNLVQRGFGRDVIMSALSVDKTELSRLISLADAIPVQVSAAIGPAPKAGRTRWAALGKALEGQGSRRQTLELVRSGVFLRLDSDARFQAAYDKAHGKTDTPKPPRPRVEEYRAGDGRVVARAELDGDGSAVVRLPAGDRELLERVLGLIAAHAKGQVP